MQLYRLLSNSESRWINDMAGAGLGPDGKPTGMLHLSLFVIDVCYMLCDIATGLYNTFQQQRVGRSCSTILCGTVCDHISHQQVAYC